MIEKAKQIVFQTFIVMVIVVALLAVGEVGARLFVPDPLSNPDGDWGSINIPYAERGKSMAYAGEDWVGDWYSTYGGGGPNCSLVYKPYVLWKTHECHSKYVNFGSDGYRVTVNPKKDNAKKTFRIFFFGGSTMAGDGILRDVDVIPSIVSRILNKRFPDVRVVAHNYGASGYLQEQGVEILTEMLRKGQVPDLVVSFDGNNDTGPVTTGQAHMDEQMFKAIFEQPRSSFLQRAAASLRWRSRLARLVLGRPKTYRPNMVVDKNGKPIPKVIDQRAAQRAEQMWGNFAFVRSLAHQYGFKILFILQPSLFTTQTLTEEEKGLSARIQRILPSLDPVLIKLYEHVDEVFARKGAGTDFVDLSHALDGKTHSAFVDHIHVGPAGNRLIGAAIADAISSRDMGDGHN